MAERDRGCADALTGEDSLMNGDEVLIVGAGPVGLTAALSLAQKGVRVTVLEASNEPHKEWRASGFHPPTLEILEPLGVVDEMVQAGRKIVRPQFRDLELPLVATTDFSLLKDDTRYPFRLHYEQYKYAALMQRHFEALPNARILYGHSVQKVVAREDKAIATVNTRNGEKTFSASWLLGADGASSAVRRSLGITFDGYSYEMRYVLLATLFPFEEHIEGLGDSVNFSGPSGTRLRMLLRIPDVWRVMLMVFPDETDEVALDDARLQEQLVPIVGKGKKVDILQKQIYRPHQRIASRLREGRIVIMGDAAHVNSPFGGMGLNGGIHDAIDLSIRLTRVLRGEVGEEEVDKYAERRSSAHLKVVRELSDAGTRTVWEETDPAKRRANLEALNRLLADPSKHREYLVHRSMIGMVRDQPIGA
jgi:3-(3-hydroxy-phenyl)propionate hydroxylase